MRGSGSFRITVSVSSSSSSSSNIAVCGGSSTVRSSSSSRSILRVSSRSCLRVSRSRRRRVLNRLKDLFVHMILEVPREYGIIAFTSVHCAPPQLSVSRDAKIGTSELEIANSRQEGHFIQRGLAHMKIVFEERKRHTVR